MRIKQNNVSAIMIISLPMYEMFGSSGINSYLKASAAYLGGATRSLELSLFPQIASYCPVCQLQGCAKWKAYYSRKVYLSEQDYEGDLAIRYGTCKRAKVDFSFLPDFLIPWRKVGRITMTTIVREWQEGRNTEIVISKAAGGSMSRLPKSTIYEYLNVFVKILRLNGVLTNDLQPIRNAISFLRNHSFSYWNWFWSKIRDCALSISHFRSPRKARRRWLKYKPDRYRNDYDFWGKEDINWHLKVLF